MQCLLASPVCYFRIDHQGFPKMRSVKAVAIYKHPDALIRMESIWRAWEHLRLNPPSVSPPGG